MAWHSRFFMHFLDKYMLLMKHWKCKICFTFWAPLMRNRKTLKCIFFLFNHWLCIRSFGRRVLGSLPVLSAHSFASNWQLPFLNQWKGENGRRNLFMTKSQRKNVLPDLRIEPATVCIPGGRSSDRATAPGCILCVRTYIWAASSEFGTYRLCEQRRFRRACASQLLLRLSWCGRSSYLPSFLPVRAGHWQQKSREGSKTLRWVAIGDFEYFLQRPYDKRGGSQQNPECNWECMMI